MTIRRILCVHPNGELYGSDRMFIETVQAFRDRWPEATLTVILPGDGPLFQTLRPIVADLRTEPLFVLRRSDFSPLAILRLPHLLRRIAHARSQLRRYDVAYISTIVALDYILATRLSSTPAVIHIHELPTALARHVFSAILRWSRATLVCISHAVEDSFTGLAGKVRVVVPNGVSVSVQNPSLEDEPSRDRFRVLLIGRLNRWKGQGLLVDAIARLAPDDRKRFEVRIVGDVYADQVQFREALVGAIDSLGLAATITLHPFVPDPSAHYRWADVVVVPSTEPEPFGLVAIEAMAHGRAVIAAAHGGLVEIVKDGVTGQLFTPGNADALAAILLARFRDRQGTVAMGQAGSLRYQENYTSDIYRRAIADVLAQQSMEDDRP